MSFRVAGARDCAPGQKWAKREAFVAFPKTMAGVGADFLREVAFWSIKSSGLLWWFCVTCAALRMTWHHFSWQAQYVRQVEWKNHQLCTQLSICEGSLAELLRFWCCQLKKMRKPCRIVSFLMLSSAKYEEVSLNCCVFDVAKFKNWGSLAE